MTKTDTELLTDIRKLERLREDVEEIAGWIERDRREPDKTLCNVQSLRRAARASGPPGSPA